MEKKFLEHYDMIVAGGGPAGVAAAIAGARNGASVLLIEAYGFLGGMASTAAVPAFCPFTDGKQVLIGGIGMEIIQALKEESFRSPFFDRKPDRIEGIDWLPIDSEALKRVLDRMVEESGARVLLHTSVIQCESRDGSVKSVTVYNKSGIRTLTAEVFVDCTGDADLTAMAGGSYDYGDEQGQVQAATLCFKIANFDVDRFMEYAKESGEDGNLNAASARARAEGAFPEGEQKVCGFSIAAEGTASLNFGHVYEVKPLDEWDLTRAETEARKRLPELMTFLRTYVPGAEKAVLAYSGPEIGIRESRRIKGEYCLTAEDYKKRTDFYDSIAYYSYPIDMHSASGADREAVEIQYQTSRYQVGEAYGIPYRSLLSREFDNLLTAGRTISCDRAMQASVRVMPACFATGQAAGTAGALCIAGRTKPKALDTETLRARLKSQGACLR